MNMTNLNSVVLFVFTISLVAAALVFCQTTNPSLSSFREGETLRVSCRNNSTKLWEPAFTCQETGLPLAIRYGEDTFIQCSWSLKTQRKYREMRNMLAQKVAPPICRIPISADSTYFLPLAFQFWGVIEPTHLYLSSSVNFIFHANKGALVAASAYSVRNHMTRVGPGGSIPFHIAIRWFHRRTFAPLYAPDAELGGGYSGWTAFVLCLMSASAAAVAIFQMAKLTNKLDSVFKVKLY
eukprot:240704_1